MKTEIFEKAKELGKEIAVSDEYRGLRRAQAAYDADIDTQSCVMRVEELNEEIEIGPSEFIALKQLEELKAEVAEIKAQIDASQSLRELREANAAFNRLMDEVNRVVEFTIDGETAVAAHGGRADAQGYRQVH